MVDNNFYGNISSVNCNNNVKLLKGANEDDDEEEEIWIKRNANGIGRRKSLSKVVLRNQNQKEFINESITSEEHITKPSAILLGSF